MLVVGLAQVVRPAGPPSFAAALAARIIAAARRRGVGLVVLPEGFLSGYCGFDYQEGEEPDWAAVGRALAEVRRACREAKVGAVVGTGWRAGGRTTNRSFLVGRDGRVAGFYDKTHLFGREGRAYRAGDRLPVFRCGGARLGLLICYDQRFPEPWRALALKGAQAVLHIACAAGAKGLWKRPVVEAHLRSRAAENGFFVLSVNRAHRHASWATCAFDPDGRLLAKAPYGRRVLLRVAVRPAAAGTKFLRQRRPELYRALGRK